MGVRQYLNENPAVGATLAAVVLIGVVIALMLTMRGPNLAAPEAFYVDLETGEFFVAEAQSDPPPSPADNPSAVARVYTCNGCDLETAFLGRAERGGPPTGPVGADVEGLEVSTDLQNWNPVADEEELVEQWGPPSCPDGSEPAPCQPGDA